MSPSLTPNEFGTIASYIQLSPHKLMHVSIEHQFRIATPKLIVAHPLTAKNVQAALSQLQQTVKADILLIQSQAGSGFRTLDEVIDGATRESLVARPFRLFAGESRTKMAFLCFSSGTTGKPKVRGNSNMH